MRCGEWPRSMFDGMAYSVMMFDRVKPLSASAGDFARPARLSRPVSSHEKSGSPAMRLSTMRLSKPSRPEGICRSAEPSAEAWSGFMHMTLQLSRNAVTQRRGHRRCRPGVGR